MSKHDTTLETIGPQLMVVAGGELRKLLNPESWSGLGPSSTMRMFVHE